MKSDTSGKSDASSKDKVGTMACVTKNYWSDSDNFSKWCTEGSVTNVVCQLLSMDEADQFKNIAVLPNDTLLSAMEVDKFPKNVQSNQTELTLSRNVSGYWRKKSIAGDHCILILSNSGQQNLLSSTVRLSVKPDI